MQPPFLAALLAASSKEHEQMWTQLLRVAFDAFADFSFLDTSALAGRLGALNALTQPPQLQAAMVRVAVPVMPTVNFRHCLQRHGAARCLPAALKLSMAVHTQQVRSVTRRHARSCAAADVELLAPGNAAGVSLWMAAMAWFDTLSAKTKTALGFVVQAAITVSEAIHAAGMTSKQLERQALLTPLLSGACFICCQARVLYTMSIPFRHAWSLPL